jgi:hypothetical protein
VDLGSIPENNDNVSPNMITWKRQLLQEDRIIWDMSNCEKCCARFSIFILKECKTDGLEVPTTIGQLFKHKTT